MMPPSASPISGATQNSQKLLPMCPREPRGTSKTEHHQHHTLAKRSGFWERPFVPARPTSECQSDVLLSIYCIGHRIPGKLCSGFEAPELLHAVFIESRDFAHNVAQEQYAASCSKYPGIGRIVGLHFFHRGS